MAAIDHGYMCLRVSAATYYFFIEGNAEPYFPLSAETVDGALLRLTTGTLLRGAMTVWCTFSGW